MDEQTLKLECLKIAADECRFNGENPKKLVERAVELAQFVFGKPVIEATDPAGTERL